MASLEKNDFPRIVLVAILGFATACALFVDPTSISSLESSGSLVVRVLDRCQALFGKPSPWFALLCIVMSIVYWKYMRSGLSHAALVVSLFFAASAILFVMIQVRDVGRVPLTSVTMGVLFVFKFIGYAAFSYLCVEKAFSWLDKGRGWVPASSLPKWSIAVALSLVLAAWIPLLIVFWPGSLAHDGASQLLVANGTRQLSNHHPVLITWIYGAIMELVATGGGLILLAYFVLSCFKLSLRYLPWGWCPFGLGMSSCHGAFSTLLLPITR